MLWPALAEYAGISDADLVEGERDERFGVEVGWQEKARRLGNAWAELQGLTPQRRSEIPALIEERRLKRHLRETERRLASLESEMIEIKRQLAAVITNLPSQKESRTAA